MSSGNSRQVREQTGGQRLRRIVRVALALLLAGGLVASLLLVWTVRRSFPGYDGTISMPGLTAPVTVHRDSYGTPQIFASTEHDLFAGQGYVHAQDRFWEMDVRRHLTSGRLSEMFGSSQVANDAFLRTVGWRRVAEQEWLLLSPETQGNLQAYADGVNAWIADNGGPDATASKSLEYAVLGLTTPGYTVRPWDPVDSIAWLKAMAWDLRGNFDEELNRATLLGRGMTAEQVDELFPAYPYDRLAPTLGVGTVVDGEFTADPAVAPAGYLPGTADPAVPGLLADQPSWSEVASLLRGIGAAVRGLPAALDADTTGIGSNAWVVSGALTDTGMPLLANDPHLSPSMPGVWYQVGLHCSCSYEAAGYSLSGLPGVVIGHNARIAWGLTNLLADVTDLYVERTDGDRYFDGTTWRQLQTRRETIDVAGGEPVSITVRSTGHGPLVSDRLGEVYALAATPPVEPTGTGAPAGPTVPAAELVPDEPGVPTAAADAPYAVALRWTALDPGRTVEALFELNRAQNWEQFRAAVQSFDVPAQNLVYADVDGNIGYQAPGRIPVRAAGEGRLPAPGWDPAYDWTGYIPFAELPHALNPPGGIVVSANQPPVGPQYAQTITTDWVYGYRAQRIHDLLVERSTRGPLTVAAMREIQFDNRNGFAATLVPALLDAPLGDGDTELDVALDEARRLLVGWDFQQPAEEPAGSAAAAAFYNATYRHLLLRTFDELPAETPPGGGERWWEVLGGLLGEPRSAWWDDRATPEVEVRDDMLRLAMRDAIDELTDLLGSDPDQWRWGDLHTFTLVHETFGTSGIAPLHWLFNRGPVAVSGGGGIVNATIWSPAGGYETRLVPTMRMIVDLAEWDASRWVQLSGNSGHAFHPNYADQMELWRTGQDTPMLWAEAGIGSHATHTLTLQPGGR